jgi:hypothetical protein
MTMFFDDDIDEAEGETGNAQIHIPISPDLGGI